MIIMEILCPTRSDEVLRSEITEELKEAAKRIHPNVYAVEPEKKVEEAKAVEADNKDQVAIV